jgi:hypothetical protein
LNQTIEQDAVKTSVAKADAVLVMLEEGVHGNPGVAKCWQLTRWARSTEQAGDWWSREACERRWQSHRNEFLRRQAAGAVPVTLRDIKGAALG